MIRRPLLWSGVRRPRRNRLPLRNFIPDSSYIYIGQRHRKKRPQSSKVLGRAARRFKALKVSAILIISVILVVVASLAVFRTKRPPSNETEYLPPGVSPRGLFDDKQAEQAMLEETNAVRAASAELEKSLLERAARGDLQTLGEASAAGSHELYAAVLERLVERCAQSPSDLRSLAAHVAHGEGLLSSRSLAESLCEEFERDPSETSTTDLVRVASLSGDAFAFGRAVSLAARVWEEGRLKGMGGGELLSLFDAEYWLLSSEARRSGAGFRLKQELADVRRRLSAEARRTAQPSKGDLGSEVSAQKE